MTAHRRSRHGVLILSAAHGLALTPTMIIPTLLVLVVARELWRWSLWRSGGVFASRAGHGGVHDRAPGRRANAWRATNFFSIPVDRVVEIGIQLEI